MLQLKRLSDDDHCGHPLKRARGFEDLTRPQSNSEDCFQSPRAPKVDLCTHALFYLCEANRSNCLPERMLSTELALKRHDISAVIVSKLRSYRTLNRVVDMYELSDLLQDFQASLGLMGLWNQLVRDATNLSAEDVIMTETALSQSSLWLSFIRFAVLLHLRPQLPKEAYQLLHSQ